MSMAAAQSAPQGMSVSDTEVAVDLVDVNKWYGEFHVLRNINLRVMRGERIVICGPSGSGKSTLIRCINRLEEFQQGSLVVDGIERTVRDPRANRTRRHASAPRVPLESAAGAWCRDAHCPIRRSAARSPCRGRSPTPQRAPGAAAARRRDR